jgi:hypothetical protein
MCKNIPIKLHSISVGNQGLLCVHPVYYSQIKSLIYRSITVYKMTGMIAVSLIRIVVFDHNDSPLYGSYSRLYYDQKDSLKKGSYTSL